MTFERVRAATTPSCEPDCPEWIAARGQITPTTAKDFGAFLAKLDARRRPVVIDSNGGAVEAAMEMGRLIRARRLAVAVGRSEIDSYPGADGAPKLGRALAYPAFCASACALVLAAGVERHASPLAVIGLHEVKRNVTYAMRKYLIHYRTVNGVRREVSRDLLSEQRNAYTVTEIAPAVIDRLMIAYFREMGEDPKLVEIMKTATPDSLHPTTPQERAATRLVTHAVPALDLILSTPPESGLSGVAEAPAPDALEAQQSWTLDPAAESGERRFSASFRLRRGGAGVAATLTLDDPSRLTFFFGVSPRPAKEQRFRTGARRGATLFLPAEAFCRQAHYGDVYVTRAEPRPPTHAPGLPDARAPLLRAPLSGIPGVARIVEEICPA